MMDVDDLCVHILILLRGGQRLSIPDIATLLPERLDKVWHAIVWLEKKQWMVENDARFQITPEGLAYLQTINAIKPPMAARNIPTVPPQFKSSGSSFLQDFALVMIVALPIIIVGLLVVLLAYVLPLLIPVVLLLAVLAAGRVGWRSLRKVSAHECLVVYRFGQCRGVRGPGWSFVLPVIENAKSVDMQRRPMELLHEMCLTHDHMMVDIDLMLFWCVIDPKLFLLRIDAPENSVRLLVASMLHKVMSHFSYGDTYARRGLILQELKLQIDDISTDWGVIVANLEIREIRPPKEIIDSTQAKMVAELHKQAVLERARARAEALQMLFEVGSKIDDKTLKLKYLDALRDLGKGASTKFIIPLEMADMLRPLVGKDTSASN